MTFAEGHFSAFHFITLPSSHTHTHTHYRRQWHCSRKVLPELSQPQTLQLTLLSKWLCCRCMVCLQLSQDTWQCLLASPTRCQKYSFEICHLHHPLPQHPVPRLLIRPGCCQWSRSRAPLLKCPATRTSTFRWWMVSSCCLARSPCPSLPYCPTIWCKAPTWLPCRSLGTVSLTLASRASWLHRGSGEVRRLGHFVMFHCLSPSPLPCPACLPACCVVLLHVYRCTYSLSQSLPSILTWLCVCIQSTADFRSPCIQLILCVSEVCMCVLLILNCVFCSPIKNFVSRVFW